MVARFIWQDAGQYFDIPQNLIRAKRGAPHTDYFTSSSQVSMISSSL